MINFQKCPECGWLHSSNIGVRVKCKRGCDVDIILGDGEKKVTYNRGPVRVVDYSEVLRQAWKTLHSLTDWTEQTLAEWLRSVPAISCDCRAFAADYVRNNPPPYGDLAGCRRWSYDFHSAVDAKVGDEPMSWEQAKAEWGW